MSVEVRVGPLVARFTLGSEQGADNPSDAPLGALTEIAAAAALEVGA